MRGSGVKFIGVDMIVISHPRSGSTQFLNVVKRTISKIVPETRIFILGEFFNVWNAGSFGELASLLAEINLNNLEVNLKGRTRVLNISSAELVQHDSFKHNQRWQTLSTIIFKDLEFIFESKEDLYNFIFVELEKRFKFYQDLKSLNYIPIIKYFFYYPAVTIDADKVIDFYKQFNNKLFRQDSIIFYRKDVKSSLLSSLIKTYYYDLEALKEPGFEHRINQAHNYRDMLPLPTRNICIEQNIIDIVSDPFIKFYNFLQENTLTNIVVSEDLFENKSITIVVNNNILILERFVKNTSDFEEELPMNYVTDKKNYFTNTEILENILAKLTTKF